MSLLKRFYTDRTLHLRSFTLNLLVSATLCAVIYHLQSPEFYQFQFAWWHLALIPLGVYIGGVSAVFIHNATHHSFPKMWLNELCGHLAGLHQLWGYMGWKLIHLVHHQYSDNKDMDPHPPKDRTFWQFARVMFLESSGKISERYREHYGMNKTTKILHTGVLIVFTALAATNLLFWYLLLGPTGFLFFYIPSYISNHLLFVDVNYAAHPKDENGETAAANLDNTLYYKIANACWFGIYYHGNHHRKPTLFNPKYMPVIQRKTRTEEVLDIAA
jgi:fatty acid desaturase